MTQDQNTTTDNGTVNTNPVIVGLDIGTTKIAAIAGRKNEYGKLEILGFGRANSNGVQHGMVLNIDQTIKAIEMALKNCYDSNPNLAIEEVYVGIAGQHIKSMQTRGDIVRQTTEEEIRQEEVDRLIADQYRTYIPAGDQIIDVIPQEFTVDNFQNIPNPIGYSGVKDIGGGTTDLAVFYEGILKHTAVIPFGGENITNDIKNGLGVLKTQAEQMKVQFGSALSDEAKANAFITIPGLRGMQPKEISVQNLAGIIQARMSEIMDFVTFHLKQVGLDTRLLNGGIILTGGGSQLKHLIQLTEYVTGLNARIGFPNEHLAGGHIEELAKPMYSTCIGLILKGYNDYENKNKQAFDETWRKIAVPVALQQPVVEEVLDMPVAAEDDEILIVKKTKQRKSLKGFMDSFKIGLIDLFKEEEDGKF